MADVFGFEEVLDVPVENFFENQLMRDVFVFEKTEKLQNFEKDFLLDDGSDMNTDMNAVFMLEETDTTSWSLPYSQFQQAFDFNNDGIMQSAEWNAAAAYFESGGQLTDPDTGESFGIYFGSNLYSNDWGPNNDMTIAEYYAWFAANPVGGMVHGMQTIWALITGNYGTAGGANNE